MTHTIMTRILAISAATFCAATIFFGCSGKSQTEAAMHILQQADTAIATADYNYALQLLDTLKAKYPQEIAIQRQAMHMRPMAIEGISIRQLEQTDSLQALYSYKTDSLLSYFTLVHNPELGSDYDYYILSKQKNNDIFEKTGIQGRVSPSGEFTIISSLSGPKVKHTAISLTAPDGSSVKSADVSYDGERNYRSGTSETITFIDNECDTIGQYLAQNSDRNLKLNYIGSKTHTTALSQADRQSVEEAWKLAYCMTQKNKLANQRMLYERQLALARDQIARTSGD